MELNIQRSTFLAGVQRTLGVTEKRTTSPILNNVLIRTKENKVRIIATDKEISLLADYDAEIIAEGDITLSARKLYEMIRACYGDTIHFKKNEHNNIVTITCDKVVYKIPGVPADDFPSIGDDIDIPLFRIEGKVLYELIRKTFSAISIDEKKKNLSGVFFKIENNESVYMAKMVAADGFRLVVSYKEIEEVAPLSNGVCGLDKGIIIPRKGVVEIRRAIEDETGSVMMGVHQGMCVVRMGSATLKVSLIDDEYPDYRRVIPPQVRGQHTDDVVDMGVDMGGVVCFKKDVVLHVLRRMSVVSSEGYDGVIIRLMKDMMVFSLNNPDVGDASEEVEVLYKGEDVEVGYKVGFLLDAIEVINEDMVIFDVGAGVGHGIISPLGNDNYICVVMPLRF